MPRVRTPGTPAKASDPLVDAFCDQLWLRDGLAQTSLASYRRDVTAFSRYLADRGSHSPLGHGRACHRQGCSHEGCALELAHSSSSFSSSGVAAAVAALDGGGPT